MALGTLGAIQGCGSDALDNHVVPWQWITDNPCYLNQGTENEKMVTDSHGACINDLYYICVNGTFILNAQCEIGKCTDTGCLYGADCTVGNTTIPDGGTGCMDGGVGVCHDGEMTLETPCTGDQVCTLENSRAVCAVQPRDCTVGNAKVPNGGTACINGGIGVCTNGEMTLKTPCDSEQVCILGADGPTCEVPAPDVCIDEAGQRFEIGKGYCDEATGALVRCGQNGQWETARACGEGLVCREGECLPPLPDDCTPGVLKCDNDGTIRVCTDSETWSDALDIPAGLVQCKETADSSGLAVTCLVQDSYCDALVAIHCLETDEVLTKSACQDGLVCDANAHACVQCTADAQCPTTLVCSTTSKTCVQCVNDSSCTASDLVCNTTTNTCVQCNTNLDCPGSQACNTTTHTCVQCMDNAECTGDLVCDTETNLCVQCTENSDCKVDGATLCDTGTNTCVQCLDDSACSAKGMVCNTATNSCVVCNTKSDCQDGLVCDPATNQCVQCTDDSVCPATSPVCDTTTHTCVECLDDTKCDGKRCNTASNHCVQCLDHSDCAGDQLCNTATNVCVQECLEDTDCQTPMKCNTATNLCVECLDDSACTASGKVCDTSTNTCVSCTTNANCTAPLVCDTAEHKCVPCVTNTDCTAPLVCNTAEHKCVECVDNSTCTAEGMVCNATTNTCVQCNTDTDCKNGKVCRTDTNTCVQCVDDSSCTADGMVCKTSTNTCVQCNADTDCTGADVCDTSKNTCVQCINDSSCNASGLICNTSTQKCVECTEGNDSVCTAQSKVCDATANRCVECTNTDSSVCSADGKVCDTPNQKCVECLASENCTSGKVCDTDAKKCVECTNTDSSVCSANGKVCDTTAQTCVECTTADASICTAGDKVCKTETQTCVECLSDSDCTGAEVCDTDTNQCLTCKDGDISCQQIQGVTQFRICSGAAWSEFQDLPSDATNSLLSCEQKFDDTCVDTDTEKCERKLLCNSADNNYCRINSLIGNDVAIVCNTAGTYPTIDVTCDAALSDSTMSCNTDLHKCVECDPGDIKCAGPGKYQLCNSLGAWNDPKDLPSDASALLRACTGNEPLHCNADTGSYCNGEIAVNCNVTPGSGSDIEKSTCGDTYTCDTTGQVCVCNEGDVKCDGYTYQVCRSGNWEVLSNSSLDLEKLVPMLNPQNEQFVGDEKPDNLDRMCPNSPKCKVTDTYCDSTITVQCNQNEAPKITDTCDDGYACVGNKCVAQPVESCDKDCGSRECVFSADKTKQICVFNEDFEYDFVDAPINDDDPLNPKDLCRGDLGPGYRAERTVNRTNWTLHSRARKVATNVDKNKLNNTKRVTLTTRGEDEEITLCEPGHYVGKRWRNFITISDFEGGVGVLMFDWANQSQMTWGQTGSAPGSITVCAALGYECDNDVVYLNRHVGKLRIFFNDIETPVAVMPYYANITNQHFEIDFREVPLPAGIDLNTVNKITIRPEYYEFVEYGSSETILGQIFIDNIRWSSATGD